MFGEDSIRELLKKLSTCNENSSENSDNTYNIFEVLGVEYKEVIVCRFIGDLLDPKGRHGLGCMPLKYFINDILEGGVTDDKELENASVNLEEHIDNDRRTDIVIYLQDKIYPIEVKIWAEDQPKQLEDYYRYYFSDNKENKIYYLTPNGRDPSEGSKGKLDKNEQISCISFKEHICDWLKKIQEDDASKDTVNFIIKGFEEVIMKMSKSDNELAVIIDFLGLNREKYDYDRINSTIALLEHCDEIWDKIRRKYIRSIFSHEEYILEDYYGSSRKRNDAGISHVLMEVKQRNETIAYICVETNLYIVKKKNAEECDNGWTEYNSDYQWKYIDNENKHIALGNPTELKDINTIHLNIFDL